MPTIICKHCGKEFYNKHSVQKFCNRACYGADKHKVADKLVSSGRNRAAIVREFKSNTGILRKGMETYMDKIISCDESPSGKAYIGVAKRPLMEADGYGYMGVVLQDETRRYIQCHECGKWGKKITVTHLKKCSGITPVEYKEKHGLDRNCGLVADETSMKCTKAALKNKESGKRIRLLNLKKGYKPRGEQRKQSLQEMNKYGTCPLQLKTRLYDFIICNRELPNCHNRGSSLYKAIRRRFGRFGEALKEYGLPTLKRVGTNYVFTYPDYTIQTFNINKFGDREQLFASLVEKCLELKANLKQCL